MTEQLTIPVTDPTQRTLEMSLLMTPDYANFIGNVHGGDLLCLLDQVTLPVQVVIQGITV